MGAFSGPVKELKGRNLKAQQVDAGKNCRWINFKGVGFLLEMKQHMQRVKHTGRPSCQSRRDTLGWGFDVFEMSPPPKLRLMILNKDGEADRPTAWR